MEDAFEANSIEQQMIGACSSCKVRLAWFDVDLYLWLSRLPRCSTIGLHNWLTDNWLCASDSGDGLHYIALYSYRQYVYVVYQKNKTQQILHFIIICDLIEYMYADGFDIAGCRLVMYW